MKGSWPKVTGSICFEFDADHAMPRIGDSIDGSGISRFDHMLEEVLAAIQGTHPQADLIGGAGA